MQMIKASPAQEKASLRGQKAPIDDSSSPLALRLLFAPTTSLPLQRVGALKGA